MFYLSHFKKMDWVLIFCAFSIALIGIFLIYSTSLRTGDLLNFKKQIIFLFIGIIAMFTASFFDYRILRSNPYFILVLYFLGLALLAGLFFFGTEIRGVLRWYKIGPFSFDPKIIVTISLIILLAKYFSMRYVEMYKFQHILFSGIYVFLPSFLIFFQPELGWILVLIIVWIGILMISGIKIRHFLTLLFCGILILTLGWQFFLRDYQKQRVVSFIFPRDPLGVSWSQNQSKIAIGSGQLLGKGWGQGSQTQYGFLPEPQTDFIFSVLAEETGFLGASILLSLFLILIWRILKIAILSRTNFSRIFAAGFAVFLFSQIFINIGMNLGLLPIIGIPLPLVSYGGSSLISIFLALGILQSIKCRSAFA